MFIFFQFKVNKKLIHLNIKKNFLVKIFFLHNYKIKSVKMEF